MQVTVTEVGDLYPGKWYFSAKAFNGAICIPPDKTRRVKPGDIVEVNAHNAGTYWFANTLHIVNSHQTENPLGVT
jgi:hypothetical protein